RPTPAPRPTALAASAPFRRLESSARLGCPSPPAWGTSCAGKTITPSSSSMSEGVIYLARCASCLARLRLIARIVDVKVALAARVVLVVGLGGVGAPVDLAWH